MKMGEMERLDDADLQDKVFWRSIGLEHQLERQEGSKTSNGGCEGGKPCWRSVFQEKTRGGLEKSEEFRDQLINLSLAIHALYPAVTTRNPYAGLLEKHLPYGDTYLQVVHLLVDSFTRLHHKFRYCHRGFYLSEREDVLSALSLLSADIESLRLLEGSVRRSYSLLYRKYGKGLFSRKEASSGTGYSKTHMQRLLNALYGLGLIERIGHKNRGYRYCLKEL